MADYSFATPEEAAEAAVSDIPPKYVRVEGVRYSDEGRAFSNARGQEVGRKQRGRHAP